MNKWLHTYFISFLNIIYLLHWLQLPSICIVAEFSTHQGAAASVWCIIAASPLFETIKWPHRLQLWGTCIFPRMVLWIWEKIGKSVKYSYPGKGKETSSAITYLPPAHGHYSWHQILLNSVTCPSYNYFIHCEFVNIPTLFCLLILFKGEADSLLSYNCPPMRLNVRLFKKKQGESMC